MPSRKKSAKSRTKKNIFIQLIVLSLLVSALLGISLFLFGNFGELEIKTLFTTFFIGLYSISGLVFSNFLAKKPGHPLGLFGLVLTGSSFLLTEAAIWELVSGTIIGKKLFSSFVITIALTHIAILLMLKIRQKLGTIILWATIIVIALLTILLTWLIQTGFWDSGKMIFRLIGVLAILDVLGSILLPIFNWKK